MMAIDHYGYSHKIIDNETHFLQYYKENGHNVDVIVVDTVGFHRMEKRLIGKQGLSKVIFKDFWGIYKPNEDGIYTSLLEASQFWTAYPVPPNTFLGFTVEDTCSRKVGRTQGFGIVWGKMPSYITYGEHVWKTIFKHFPLNKKSLANFTSIREYNPLFFVVDEKPFFNYFTVPSSLRWKDVALY